MSRPDTRIVVADSQPLFTLGVRSLLANHPSIRVVGDAATGQAALDQVDKCKPDVLLLDSALERISALEVLQRLSPSKWAPRTVLVASTISTPNLRTALLRGAYGVLLKEAASELLIKCITRVMAGEFWIGRDQVADLVDALRSPAPADEPAKGLSHRECDIVRAVARGASNKDIAGELGLGEQTVKNHLRRIFAKIGVANRVELAIHATAGELATDR
ncbi:MAG: LuxR C-terminal-related transcriptional regulator [Acidobacteriota bacterium]